MGFPNLIHIAEDEVFNQYSEEKTPYGLQGILPDGRVFRMAKVGATALVIGSLNQGEAPSTNYSDEVIGTLAAGVTTLTGVGATGAEMAVNALKYGYIYSSPNTELPLMRVKDNTALPAGSTGTVYLYTPTPAAIAAATTVSYFKNPWRDVVIHDSPATAVYTGVCKLAATATYYAWLQTRGPCSVLYDSSTTAIAAVNDPVVGDTAVDGAVSGAAAGTAETNPIVGVSLGIVEGDGEQTTVFLMLE